MGINDGLKRHVRRCRNYYQSSLLVRYESDPLYLDQDLDQYDTGLMNVDSQDPLDRMCGLPGPRDVDYVVSTRGYIRTCKSIAWGPFRQVSTWEMGIWADLT